MFAKSRKEKFVGQAQDLAHDLSEAIAPAVERARDEIGPRLSDARDAIAPHLADARDQVAPKLADARDAIGPRLADARDAIGPRLADARDEIAPRLADARDQLTPYAEDARDKITKGAAAAAAAATPIAVEARRRGDLAAAALKGEPVKRKGGKKKYLVLAGLLGLGAVAFKKLRGGDESSNWQTSYAPTPAPTAAPATPSTPSTGTHVAAVTDETVGATPDESLSDAVEAPHAVTTPDDPAEAVDVTKVEDPKES